MQAKITPLERNAFKGGGDMAKMAADGKIFNIGIVGLGDNGMMHLNGFKKLPDCRVAAVCDKRDEARERAMGVLKDSSVVSTPDYKKLCAMPELDAVCVCTPTFTHTPIASLAIECGKDVLLEKPIAPNIEEVDAFIVKAFKTDRIVQVGLVYRYCNLYRTLAAMVEKGDFGDVMMAYCKEYRDNFPTQWFFETEKSGGALLDKNCHHFDLFSWFIRSRPYRVFAMGGQHVVKGKSVKVNCSYAPDQNLMIKNPDIVDHAFVLVEYENGARANLGLCMYEVDPLEGLEIGIIGSNGSHALAKRDVTLNAGGGPQGMMREVPVDYVSDNLGIGHIGAHIQHVEFVQRMRDRRQPFASLLRARESMVVCMAAERSIKEKREVKISEYDSPAIKRLMKKYAAEFESASPSPLPAPRRPKEAKASREKELVDAFVTLVRLLMGKRPLGKAAPFARDTFVAAAKRINADSAYLKMAKGLNTVVTFEYPGKEPIAAVIRDGKLEIVPSRTVVEEARVIFTEKGWEELQAGDSIYRVFLSGNIKVDGDPGKLRPYTEAFLRIGKSLSAD